VFDRPQAYAWAFRRWYQFLFRRLSVTARLVLTVSEFSKGRLVARLGVPEDRIAVVGNGADHLAGVAADTAVLDRLALQPGRFLLAVGSGNTTKNHAAMAEAFNGLATAPGIRLVIVGGNDPTVFAAGGAAVKSDRVVRAGAVGDAQLKALYEAALGLVFPSTYEGFGLPPVEAMGCGCPVIASNAAAIPEVCGDAALYFDPHSVADIRDAMQRLIEDPALRERLRAGGRQRTATLTWERAARRLLSRLEAAGAVEVARR
jgi:glycosyltransferase involved in cell wall biosynthesis